MRPRALSPAEVRRRLGVPLAPTGEVAGRFGSTKGADRQILADAAAAGAHFLVTEDVDDFVEVDLTGVGVSAVNPDLFLAERLTREAYAFVINLFIERQVAPSTTAAEFHHAVARQHPLLFAAHADLYDVQPAASVHPPPAVRFRGTRCLNCETVVDRPRNLLDGLCADCRRARGEAVARAPGQRRHTRIVQPSERFLRCLGAGLWRRRSALRHHSKPHVLVIHCELRVGGILCCGDESFIEVSLHAHAGRNDVGAVVACDVRE